MAVAVIGYFQFLKVLTMMCSPLPRRVAARLIQFFINFVNDCAPLPGRVAEEEDSDGGYEDEGHVDIPALLTQHPRRRGG